MIDQGLAINPGLAAGWILAGRHETAPGEYSHALRLNPKDPESCRPEAGFGQINPVARQAERSFGSRVPHQQ